MNEEGERSVIGLMNESTLRVVFTKRLYEAMVPQGVSNVRYRKSDWDVRVIGGRDMFLEGERYLHSAAGKGLR